MSDPRLPRNGIHCPTHPTARLCVVTVRKVAVGIVVRYRMCKVEGCGYKVPTEERIRPTCGKPRPNCPNQLTAQ